MGNLGKADAQPGWNNGTGILPRTESALHTTPVVSRTQNHLKWHCSVVGDNGSMEGCRFYFTMKFSTDYPSVPPNTQRLIFDRVDGRPFYRARPP